jgi:arylsulfatase A-like enzyme
MFDSEAGFEAGFSGSDRFGGAPERSEVDGAEPLSDERVVRAFENLLARSEGKPLFAWLHLFTPHTPYREKLAALPFEGHLADVHLLDGIVGRLLGLLRKSQRYQHCLLVLTADHGEAFGQKGVGSPELGLHGLGLQEVEVRVPLLLRVPDGPAGEVNVPVSGLDIAPTLLAAVGVPVPEEYVGEDLRVIEEARQRTSAVFLEQWLLASRHSFRTRWIASVDPETCLKTLFNERNGTVLAYDLVNDPKEEHDRFDANALAYDRADTRSLARLLGWRRAIVSKPPYFPSFE